MAARVPDLGSDFAQKLLQDLRRRRERLGFGSGSTQNQQQQQRATSSPAAASRVRSQKPRQAAAVAAQRTHQQQSSTSNAVASAGKPRHVRRDVAPVVAAADARAIVPFQGGGKTNHAVVAGNVDVQMAALALALSEGGKLRNIDMVARNGSVFFRQPDAARRGGGCLHAGEVAIGVQDLNDMLVAAYSSGGRRRRRDEESRNRFFRGSMDMEEALSMLVMLQDASGFMEGSGSGNALLLKGKESRESSARIEEIVDEDSDAADHAKNASMQIVVHNEFQSHQRSSNISNTSEGEKDGSKVRMPSVIAKLMGLENLPSSTTMTTTKSVEERKGTEKFVRPGPVPRMEVRGSAMDRKLPIRIVASEKGQHKIVLAEEWKNGLTKFGDSEIGAAALSNSSSSHPATGNNNRQGRLTMREVLRRMVAAERGVDESHGPDERIIHEDKRIAEEIKMQSSVSVGCRADSGKKMDFLKRFRKNSDNRPVKEEKHTAQEKNAAAAAAGKKQATGMRRLLGRDGEAKSRRAREKLNKENLAAAQTKGAGKKGNADQVKRQAQSKHVQIQSKPRKPQNCRTTHSETPSRSLGNKKKPLMSEAGNVKKKPECNVVTQQGNEEHVKRNDTISSSKPADSARREEGLSEPLAMVVRSSITAGAASLDQPLRGITEETSDPTIPAETVVVQANEDLNLLDQIVEVNDERIYHIPSETTQIPETFAEEEEEEQQQQMRINHTPSEAIQILETFAAEERQQQHQQQQQHQMIVKEQLTDGSDQTATTDNSTASPDHKTHVVSCDSFTENQLLLMKLLVKDRYLLETAKAIVRVDAPVSFIDDDTARNWSDKGNDLLSDAAREVIRRKGKRSEAVEQVSIARTANLKLRYLDDLVRELDGDVESLDMCSRKPHRQGDNGAAEGLQMILRSDIRNDHPDANSTWDFGWNSVGDLPIEKGEVVRDLEKNILGGIITDVARDLIGASATVRHGCCPCVA